MKEIPGIISVIGGDSDAFSSVLPRVGDSIEKEAPSSNPESENVTKESIREKEEVKADVKESTAYILANALKESGLDLGDMKQDMALSDFTSKIKGYLESNIETRAKELYGEDTIEAAKMLNSGMSLENRTEYARLKVLANHKYEVNENMTEEEKEVMTNDAKEVIKEYYGEKLTGKALERAVNGIDEYDDGFSDEYKTASDYFKGKEREFSNAELSKIKETKDQAATYGNSMRKAIEDGSIYGGKMTKAEIDITLKNIYDTTEDMVIDGEKVKVSKYEKMYHEIKKDPVLGARLMAIVAEGLDLNTAKNIGKGDFAAELEKKLVGAMDFPGRGAAVVGGRQPLNGIKGILEVID